MNIFGGDIQSTGHDHAAIDGIEDPALWAARAVEACRSAWERSGRRYARRLAETDRVRDPLDDVLALAARRVVPLRPPVLRPLPADRLGPVERSFNRLDPADRYVLRRLFILGRHAVSTRSVPAPTRSVPGPTPCSPARSRPDAARDAHLASALQRLAEALDPAELATPARGDDGPEDGPDAGVGGVD